MLDDPPQVSQIKHYPPADGEPAASDLARFLWPDESWPEGKERLLLGNGEIAPSACGNVYV